MSEPLSSNHVEDRLFRKNLKIQGLIRMKFQGTQLKDLGEKGTVDTGCGEQLFSIW